MMSSDLWHWIIILRERCICYVYGTLSKWQSTYVVINKYFIVKCKQPSIFDKEFIEEVDEWIRSNL